MEMHAFRAAGLGYLSWQIKKVTEYMYLSHVLDPSILNKLKAFRNTTYYFQSRLLDLPLFEDSHPLSSNLEDVKVVGRESGESVKTRVKISHEFQNTEACSGP